MDDNLQGRLFRKNKNKLVILEQHLKKYNDLHPGETITIEDLEKRAKGIYELLVLHKKEPLSLKGKTSYIFNQNIHELHIYIFIDWLKKHEIPYPKSLISTFKPTTLPISLKLIRFNQFSDF